MAKRAKRRKPAAKPAQPFGRFIGRVVATWLTEPDLPDRVMVLEEDFSYTDPDNRPWPAPRMRRVNGASIPAVFWGLTFGSPYTGDFRRASVVHDIACEDRPLTSDDVHRMFYYAMRCDGTSPWLAGVMYAAVKLFGPQWKNGRRRSIETSNRNIAIFTAWMHRLSSDATLAEIDREIGGLMQRLSKKESAQKRASGRHAAQPLLSGVPDTHRASFGSLVHGGYFSSDPYNLSVPRALRTNNPGALNISAWQRSRKGYAGETQPDGSPQANRTTIYRTPEHGVAAWFHLLAVRYGLANMSSFPVLSLAQKYAGSPGGSAVERYITGWSRWSGGALKRQTRVSLASEPELLVLARAMFAHEAGRPTPLLDAQIVYGIRAERGGTLPA